MSKVPAFRFYPSDFMGSPDVQAMDLHEVGAYIFLLSTAWLSERPGFLPDDAEKLRRWARMSRKQWAESRTLLLSKFPLTEEGWRANPRLVLESEKQKTFSDSQSIKGKLGGRPTKTGSKPELYDRNPELSSGIFPEKPSVSVSVSKEKPCDGSADARAIRGSDKHCVTYSDPRHATFKSAWDNYFAHQNGMDAPWDGKEAKHLCTFLIANPNFTDAQWAEALRNRAASEVAHGEALSGWIGQATIFASSRLDRYRKPLVQNKALEVQPVSALEKLKLAKGQVLQ